MWEIMAVITVTHAQSARKQKVVVVKRKLTMKVLEALPDD